MKNQIIGLVRFSYLSKNGFRTQHENREQARQALYAPERMEFRFRMVEHLCLPSLRNQTDQDFKIVFLVGQDLPTIYMKRLKKLLAPFPQAVIVAQPWQWMVQATQIAFKRVIEPDADFVTTFRLDDDDAVALDYISQTRARINRLISAGMVDEPTVLAFTSGIYWNTEKGREGLRQIKEKTPLGLACAMVTTADLPVSVFRRNHRLFGSYFQTLLIPSDTMFLRTLHEFNDSAAKWKDSDNSGKAAEIEVILAKRFGIDLERLINDLNVGPERNRFV